jgi:hypothetical protein
VTRTGPPAKSVEIHLRLRDEMRLHDERASNEAEPPHLPEVEAGHDRLTGARSSA